MSQSATKRIAYNTAIQAAGKGFIMVLAALSVGVLTRYLGAAGYGDFTIALVYLSFFGIIADLGLFTIALREISKDESRAQEIVANTLSMRAIMSVLVFSLAIFIATLLPYSENVKVAIAIAAGAQFFGLLNSALITVFQAKLKMQLSVISDVIGRTVSLLAVLLAVYYDLGFYAIVGTAVLGSLITFIVSTILARPYVHLAFYKNFKLWKEMFIESLPLGAALVVVQIYFRVDILLLSFLSTAAAVGVYGAVYKVTELLLTLPGFFQNSFFPIIIGRLKEGTERTLPALQKAFDFLLLMGVAFAAGGLTLAPQVLRIIGGPEFASGGDALRIALFAMAFSFVTLLFSSVYVAKGRQIVALWFGLIGLGLNIALNLVAIPLYGINGAAAVTLISEVVIFTLYWRTAATKLGLPVSLRNVPRVVIAGAAMVAVMWPLQQWFLLSFVAGGITYFAAAFALGLVSKDIVRELKPR